MKELDISSGQKWTIVSTLTKSPGFRNKWVEGRATQKDNDTLAITEDGETISGDCSSYLPASGGLDTPDIELIDVTLQRTP